MTAEQDQRIRDAQHRAFLARERADVWSEKYAEARRVGFNDSDARLHADQAVEYHDQQRRGR